MITIISGKKCIFMKRILITGGAGFIGSHTCVNLLEKGYEVYLIDSFINSSPAVINKILAICNANDFKLEKNLKVFEGDLKDKNFIENFFSNLNESGKAIDGVIHFAGLKAVNESVVNPLLYWYENIFSTFNLVSAMNKNNCNLLVFSSSATVYGKNSVSPIKENSELNPSNPYGNTKLAIEKFLGDIYSQNKNIWKIACLRYFNPIGAHPSSLIGENPVGKPNNLFPLICNAALDTNQKLKIFGSDWNTNDGTCIRDYIHVSDVAEGHLRTLEYLDNNEANILKMNIGTGFGTSVLELIETFSKINNVKVDYEFTSRRKGDLEEIVADNSLARYLLNWEPKRSLEEMCIDGWKWKKNNINGY